MCLRNAIGQACISFQTDVAVRESSMRSLRSQNGQAPSSLAVMWCYILTPAIFDELKDIPRGADGEIPLTHASAMLLADDRARVRIRRLTLRLWLEARRSVRYGGTQLEAC